MTIFFAPQKTAAVRLATIAATVFLAATTALAQAPQARITSAIDNSSRASIAGSLSPRAIPANDVGAVPPSTRLQSITLVLSRTPAQQAALDALVAAQQNPSSPLYHQWLTPTQFGAQFGAAASDIAAIEAWLQQQGFSIDGVSHSRDRISFSGTEAQVESAFDTQLHYFKSADGNHFAPATAISVPSAIASSVLSVENLSSFRPHPRFIRRAVPSAQPNFTSSTGTGSYIYLTPGDIDTIYDITPAYNAGYTGVGSSIAIIGQSAIIPSDITTFQTAIGLTAKAPNQVLVPNTGSSAINPDGAGDEGESDLDLEYSSSIAKGASIYFVYTGNSLNTNGVFTALTYAVDEDIAPIISESYGGCEPLQGSSFITQFNLVLEQAAAQGQTVVNASGDSGSTDCSGETGTGITVAEQEQLAVDYPASSAYVTGIGGSEFPPADTATGNSTYFNAPTSTDTISSAKSYIPEQVWNDDAVLEQYDAGVASGGGGVSIYTPRPTWQAGTIGGVAIPSGTYRMVPDVSLDASNYSAPYIFCSSDQSTWNTAANGGVPPYQTSSCTSGLRDSSTGDLTAAGGTSFATPIFAGMVAIINQAKGYVTGQGLINPTLYSLASNSTTYASAFHDITSGGNQCLAGPNFCNASGESEYPAAVGYDEASGLGSVNLNNLLTAWPQFTTVITGTVATTTTITPATTTPNANAADLITITVAPTTGTGTPTGTLKLTVDGVVINSALALTNGSATYSFTSAAAGSHIIVATYSGSTTYAQSTATSVLSVGGTTTSTGTLTLTVPNMTVTQGSSATENVTVTPGGGYTGTVEFGIGGTIAYACATGGANVIITSTAAGTTTLTITTNTSTCSNGIELMKGATGKFASGARLTVVSVNTTPRVPQKPSPLGPASSGLAAAGLLVAGFFGRRSRKLRSCVTVCLLALFGLALSGCSNTTTSPTTTPKGTYTLTLSAEDSVNTAITTSTTFTVTVQ